MFGVKIKNTVGFSMGVPIELKCIKMMFSESLNTNPPNAFDRVYASTL